MEGMVKNALSKTLGPIVLGFRKDQLNLSMLGGNASMNDIEVNCELVNEKIRESQDVPFEFKRVYVSSLAVQASMKYKTRPLVIELDEVIVDLVEPQSVVPPRDGPKPQKPKKKSKYSTGDRVGDGVTVIIKSLKLSAQTLGLYKTVIDPTDPNCCQGPWTPPKIQLEVNNIHVCATDDQFEPRDLATLWKANKGQPEVMTYKKATLGSLKATLTKPDADGSKSMVLLDEASPLKVFITTKKEARTGVTLDNKVEVKMHKFHIHLKEGDGSMGLLVHFLLGITQCFAREGHLAWHDDLVRQKLWEEIDERAELSATPGVTPVGRAAEDTTFRKPKHDLAGLVGDGEAWGDSDEEEEEGGGEGSESDTDQEDEGASTEEEEEEEEDEEEKPKGMGSIFKRKGKSPPRPSDKKTKVKSVSRAESNQERTRNVFAMDINDFAMRIHAANSSPADGDDGGGGVGGGGGGGGEGDDEGEGVLGQGYLFEARGVAFESIQDAAGETSTVQAQVLDCALFALDEATGQPTSVILERDRKATDDGIQGNSTDGPTEGSSTVPGRISQLPRAGERCTPDNPSGYTNHDEKIMARSSLPILIPMVSVQIVNQEHPRRFPNTCAAQTIDVAPVKIHVNSEDAPRLAKVESFVEREIDDRWAEPEGWHETEQEGRLTITDEGPPLNTLELPPIPGINALRLRLEGVRLELAPPTDVPSLPTVRLMLGLTGLEKSHTLPQPTAMVGPVSGAGHTHLTKATGTANGHGAAKLDPGLNTDLMDGGKGSNGLGLAAAAAAGVSGVEEQVVMVPLLPVRARITIEGGASVAAQRLGGANVVPLGRLSRAVVAVSIDPGPSAPLCRQPRIGIEECFVALPEFDDDEPEGMEARASGERVGVEAGAGVRVGDEAGNRADGGGSAAGRGVRSSSIDSQLTLFEAHPPSLQLGAHVGSVRVDGNIGQWVHVVQVGLYLHSCFDPDLVVIANTTDNDDDALGGSPNGSTDPAVPADAQKDPLDVNAPLRLFETISIRARVDELTISVLGDVSGLASINYPYPGANGYLPPSAHALANGSLPVPPSRASLARRNSGRGSLARASFTGRDSLGSGAGVAEVATVRVSGLHAAVNLVGGAGGAGGAGGGGADGGEAGDGDGVLTVTSELCVAVEVENTVLHQLVLGTQFVSSTLGINRTLQHMNGSNDGPNGVSSVGSNGNGPAPPHECSIILRHGTAVVPNAILTVHLVQSLIPPLSQPITLLSRGGGGRYVATHTTVKNAWVAEMANGSKIDNAANDDASDLGSDDDGSDGGNGTVAEIPCAVHVTIRGGGVSCVSPGTTDSSDGRTIAFEVRDLVCDLRVNTSRAATMHLEATQALIETPVRKVFLLEAGGDDDRGGDDGRVVDLVSEFGVAIDLNAADVIKDPLDVTLTGGTDHGCEWQVPPGCTTRFNQVMKEQIPAAYRMLELKREVGVLMRTYTEPVTIESANAGVNEGIMEVRAAAKGHLEKLQRHLQRNLHQLDQLWAGSRTLNMEYLSGPMVTLRHTQARLNAALIALDDARAAGDRGEGGTGDGDVGFGGGGGRSRTNTSTSTNSVESIGLNGGGSGSGLSGHHSPPPLSNAAASALYASDDVSVGSGGSQAGASMSVELWYPSSCMGWLKYQMQGQVQGRKSRLGFKSAPPSVFVVLTNQSLLVFAKDTAPTITAVVALTGGQLKPTERVGRTNRHTIKLVATDGVQHAFEASSKAEAARWEGALRLVRWDPASVDALLGSADALGSEDGTGTNLPVWPAISASRSSSPSYATLDITAEGDAGSVSGVEDGGNSGAAATDGSVEFRVIVDVDVNGLDAVYLITTTKASADGNEMAGKVRRKWSEVLAFNQNVAMADAAMSDTLDTGAAFAGVGGGQLGSYADALAGADKLCGPFHVNSQVCYLQRMVLERYLLAVFERCSCSVELARALSDLLGVTVMTIIGGSGDVYDNPLHSPRAAPASPALPASVEAAVAAAPVQALVKEPPPSRPGAGSAPAASQLLSEKGSGSSLSAATEAGFDKMHRAYTDTTELIEATARDVDLQLLQLRLAHSCAITLQQAVHDQLASSEASLLEALKANDALAMEMQRAAFAHEEEQRQSVMMVKRAERQTAVANERIDAMAAEKDVAVDQLTATLAKRATKKDKNLLEVVNELTKNVMRCEEEKKSIAEELSQAQFDREMGENEARAKEEARSAAFEETERENAALRQQVLELKGGVALAQSRQKGAEARFDLLQTQISNDHEDAIETLRTSMA